MCVWQLALTKIPNLDAGFQAPLPFLKSHSDCHKEREKKRGNRFSHLECVCVSVVTTMQKSGKLFPHFSEIVEPKLLSSGVSIGNREVQVCCNEKEKWMAGQKDKS